MFWSLRNSDPYKALSFDRLHTNHLGLFKDHLWRETKQAVQEMGRSAVGKVEDQSVQTLSDTGTLAYITHKGQTFSSVAQSLPLQSWCYGNNIFRWFNI